jgi:exopolysaccharide biosynthesis polyprenyl glycosylphosphotransferase
MMHSTAGLGKAAEQSGTPATKLNLPSPLNLVEVAPKRTAAERFRTVIAFAEALIDLLTVNFAVVIGYLAYYHLHLGKHIRYPLKGVFGVAFAFAIVVLLMLDRVGAYDRGNGLLRIRETEQVLRVSIQAFLIAFAASFFTNVLVSRWLLLISLTIVPLALFVEKNIVYRLVHVLHSRGYGLEKALIYGSGSTGRRVFSALCRSPRLGLDAVAFIDDNPVKAGTVVYEMSYDRRRSAPVVQGPVRKELIARYGADLLIITIPLLSDHFNEAIGEALAASARVAFVPSHFVPSDSFVDYDDIDGVLLASFGKKSQRRVYEVTKRIGDVVASTVLMMLGSPVFLLLVALIKLDSEGPAFFCQERVGQHGKMFRMYKFRTMHTHASHYEYSPNAQSDPRITRFGKFLRRTSLDELPQLLNVIKGNMSLVGPRPEMPFIVEKYTAEHRQRLEVKPGLTGLWQLSGDRAFLIHENIEYDFYYIRHRNLFMDLAILLHTSVFAMRGI